MGQYLLAMRDIGDSNSGCAVFGFVTIGDRWQMLRYAGKSFQMTHKFLFLFGDMGNDKEGWVKDCSILVDCMNLNFALSNGGILPRKLFLKALVV